MSGSTTKKVLLKCLGVGTVVAALSVPALAMPPEPNPDRPFGKILREIRTLKKKIGFWTGPCSIPPVWGKKIPGAKRFVAVLDGEAYCDKETGLVWERRGTDGGIDKWKDAITHCATKEVGGRKGWALPMREELASLVDNTSTEVDLDGITVRLPDGHPFNILGRHYWTASTDVTDPTNAWIVSFNQDLIFLNEKDDAFQIEVWCVRGGQRYDGQDVPNAGPAS